MYPPLFEICKANGPVQSALGNNPMRLYPFGQAPPNVAKPYAVFQGVFGNPENFLNQLPVEDSYGVQVDVYAISATSARDTAKAIRNALEPHAHITSWRGESRDTETTNYSYGFDVSFITERA